MVRGEQGRGCHGDGPWGARPWLSMTCPPRHGEQRPRGNPLVIAVRTPWPSRGRLSLPTGEVKRLDRLPVIAAGRAPSLAGAAIRFLRRGVGGMDGPRCRPGGLHLVSTHRGAYIRP